MRIALLQMNPLIGDVHGNTQKISEAMRAAHHAGAELMITPELAILGYPPKDLLLRQALIDANRRAVDQLARQAHGLHVLVGFADPNAEPTGRSLRNAAALLGDGRVLGVCHKRLLPTYDVFDESRYFEPADAPTVFPIGGRNVGVAICEDMWNEPLPSGRRLYETDPVAELVGCGADLLVNLSASHFVVGKPAFRRRLFGGHARRCGVPIAFCNQWGGQDELVFDGGSFVVGANGGLLASARGFADELLLADVGPSGTGGPVAEAKAMSDLAGVHAALVVGIRDYVTKCGFGQVLVALSGGIDSALVAALAVEALGAPNVRGVGLPSRYSSGHSRSDAALLAENLGIGFHEIGISAIHAAFEEALAPAFAGSAPDQTEENIQSRTRGALMMAMSNKCNALLLTTGNKSEMAVGYCTLYGDMCGALAVIGDLPKTLVYALAHEVNRSAAAAGRKAPIPEGSLFKAPSAELRADQTDQQSLPAYPLLDAILERYVELEMSREAIIAELCPGEADAGSRECGTAPARASGRQIGGVDADTFAHDSVLGLVDQAAVEAVEGQSAGGFTPEMIERVCRLVDISEYKRRQAAPVLKVTGRSFGSGRRVPIACRVRL